MALLLGGAAFAADPIVGTARVVDGDTIQVAGTRIRLLGLDAPEQAQLCTDMRTGISVSCGVEARRTLSALLGQDEVSCLAEGEDRYGRLLARCQVQGQDVGAAMVRSGWALAFVRYTHAYEAQEAEARAAGAGLWATHFIPPWTWRKGSH